MQIRQFFDRKFGPKPSKQAQTKPSIFLFFLLSCLGSNYHHIKKELQQYIQNHLPDCKLRFIHNTNKLLLSLLPAFSGGLREHSSRLSLHTARSSITFIISLGCSTKRFHTRSSMQLIVPSNFRSSTGLLPFALAGKACLGRLSWGILRTWSKLLSWDLSSWKSNGWILKGFLISELRSLLNSVTPSILRKNLISDVGICDHSLSVVTQTSWPYVRMGTETISKIVSFAFLTILVSWQPDSAKLPLPHQFFVLPSVTR